VEKWKSIDGFKGIYEVSDFGRVRSISRIDSLKREKEGKVLMPHVNRYGYSVITLHLHGKNHLKTIHRLVASAFLPDYSELLQVDHVNGDRGNNYISNLRMTNQTNNNGNARKLNPSSSKYKGVTWHKRDKRWIARIQKEGKQFQIGYYLDEIEAARAYDVMAIELYGEFSMTNKRLGLL